MAVRIYTNSYGSPGDVEKKNCALPSTLAEWNSLVKEAIKNNDIYVEVEETPTGGQLTPSKALVNIYQVEWVVQL